MEDLTLYQYFQKYIVSKRRMPSLGDELAQDSLENYIYERPQEQPVRFSNPHPSSNPEGFFYNMLLKTVPFRLEADLLSPSNGPKLYYTECCLRKILEDEEDLEVGVRCLVGIHVLCV
jgi:hypothetical protein